MMNKAEINYANSVGRQVAKGGVLYCPLCAENLGVDFKKDDQDLICFGDYKCILFCPHCETTVELVVDLDHNNGKWADHVLLGEE